MAQIIAGVYEIEKRIGAGGGGIVYLGRHIRLNKTVVLKADRRKLNASEETLRREVDMLKNLSHTYIPQVYDFVQDGEDVYTVMDFIDGENLDELMTRVKRVSQPQLIIWACQLLEALDYLHKQPPHGILHGDIKPANIMARPNGDICLIDYNIALALGEDGAVKVGYSRGYASPEHYGADYIIQNKSASVGTKSHSFKSTIDSKTEILPENVPVVAERYVRQNHNPSLSDTCSKKEILLDARSDIYSLGATLYYLISGIKPDPDARKVVALGKEVCSPEISRIIKKAMEPQPDDRYQTAEEMLFAFHNLYKSDHRVIRYKRKVFITATILTFMLIGGGACTFIGLNQMKQKENALALAEYSKDALREGNVSKAIEYALEAIPKQHSILNAPVTAQAQEALTEALGVYNLSDSFEPLDLEEISSAPFHLEMSPDGDKVAVTYAFEVLVYDIKNRRKVVTLPISKSALADAYFVDNNMIAYAGVDGLEVFDLNKKTICWTGSPATVLAISGDGERIAAVYRDSSYATVYRTEDGGKICDCDYDGKHLPIVSNDIFADPEDEVFALNKDGTMLATSFSDGSLVLYDLENENNDMVIYNQSEYSHFEGGFYDKKFFSYIANGTNGSVFELIRLDDGLSVGSFESQDELHLKIQKEGIYLANGKILSKIDPISLEEKEEAYLQDSNILNFSVCGNYALVSTDDNKIKFFDSSANCVKEIEYDKCLDFVVMSEDYAIAGNRNDPNFKILKLNRNIETRVFAYDASLDHDEARISTDDKYLMLFNYQEFSIIDSNGQIVDSVDLPDAENIYDQQFVRNDDGDYLEVTWYDGNVKSYSVQDGHIIHEEVKEKPDKSLEEEFNTATYKVISSLHKAPKIYDKKHNRMVGKLDNEDYLTYVTEIDGKLIVEFVSTEGKRYGLLLDADLETLAYLPNLCDIKGQTLYFDDHNGYIKSSRLYTIKELLDLADKMYE